MKEISHEMLNWMRNHPGNLIGNASTQVARGLSELYPCGRLKFESGDLIGFRDIKGNVVIEPQYYIAYDFSPENIAAVAGDNGWAYIDPFGTVLVRPYIVDNGPDPFNEGLARYTAGGKGG